MIKRLEFKDVTIEYDENRINPKRCRKIDRLMLLCTIVSAFIIFALIICYFIFVCDGKMNMAVSMISGTIFILAGIFVAAVLIDWLLCRNEIKAYSFMSWAFSLKDIYAGWFSGNILIRTESKCGIDSYSLRGFLDSIKNELEVMDYSDKLGSIHILVDVTSDDKTTVTIFNGDAGNEETTGDFEEQCMHADESWMEA